MDWENDELLRQKKETLLRNHYDAVFALALSYLTDKDRSQMVSKTVFRRAFAELDAGVDSISVSLKLHGFTLEEVIRVKEAEARPDVDFYYGSAAQTGAQYPYQQQYYHAPAYGAQNPYAQPQQFAQQPPQNPYAQPQQFVQQPPQNPYAQPQQFAQQPPQNPYAQPQQFAQQPPQNPYAQPQQFAQPPQFAQQPPQNSYAQPQAAPSQSRSSAAPAKNPRPQAQAQPVQAQAVQTPSAPPPQSAEPEPEPDLGPEPYSGPTEEENNVAPTPHDITLTPEMRARRRKRARNARMILFFNIFAVMLMLWVVFGLLRRIGVFPELDIGYNWFNNNILKLF